MNQIFTPPNIDKLNFQKNIDKSIQIRKDLFNAGTLVTYDKIKQIQFNESEIPTQEIITKCYNIMVSINEPIMTSYNFGLSSRFIIIDAEPYYYINPKIVFSSEQNIKMLERDVSLKNFVVKNNRPDEVRVRYSNIFNEVDSTTFKGYSSFAVQHCIDVLNNELFYRNVSLYNKERAFKEKAKRDKIEEKQCLRPSKIILKPKKSLTS